MKVAVGSTNPGKILAVKEAFQTVWPDRDWDVVGVSVDSQVSDQPMSAVESIKGASHRAQAALAGTDADFGLGLESGLENIDDKWFDTGWVVVINKSGKTGLGSTIRMHCPSKMMDMVRKGTELGHVDDILFGTTNSKQGNGHFGLMTNNAVTRSQMYRDGIISALACFIHPEIYE